MAFLGKQEREREREIEPTFKFISLRKLSYCREDIAFECRQIQERNGSVIPQTVPLSVVMEDVVYKLLLCYESVSIAVNLPVWCNHNEVHFDLGRKPTHTAKNHA